MVIIEQLPDLMGMKAVALTPHASSQQGLYKYLSLISYYSWWLTHCVYTCGFPQHAGMNPCSRPAVMGCSHLCLNRPTGAVCACPMGLELMRDNRTCVTPDAFLVFSRRTVIRWQALDMGHSDVALPLIGVREANAIDFDVATRRIYWTDLQAKVWCSISDLFSGQ